MLPYHREVVVFHLILDSLQISFFSHYPDDVSLLEDSGRGYVRQILTTFFQSYNHAVVSVSDTTFDERLAQEFAGRRDDELAEFHFALFYFSLLGQQVALQGGIEFLQLVIVADYLQLVAREDDHVAVRDVQPVRAAVNAAHVNTETLAQMQFSQRFASPTAIFWYFKFADVDISV